MSAVGPKRTSLVAPHMSAFGSKADSPHITHLITSSSSAKEFIKWEIQRCSLTKPLASSNYLLLCWEEHISGSRVLGLTGQAIANEFSNGPKLWPHVSAG
jgi:hypothetical protein